MKVIREEGFASASEFCMSIKECIEGFGAGAGN
jgi:hypothetical protein